MDHIAPMIAYVLALLAAVWFVSYVIGLGL